MRLLPLLLALPLLAAAPPAGPKWHGIACWTIAKGAWLELRAYERGTPQPLELRIEQGNRRGADLGCREPGESGPLPPLGAPVPAPFRVEWQAARDWSAAAAGFWPQADGQQVVAELPDSARLAGTDGALVLLPRAVPQGAPDSLTLRLTTGGVTREFGISAAQGRRLAWVIGEQANVLDPAGRADYDAVLAMEQVDEPPRPVASPACMSAATQRMRELHSDDVAHGGYVVVRFVVGTDGVPQPETVQFEASTLSLQLTEAARDMLGCYSMRPARLRGRAVRVAFRQHWHFRTGLVP